MVEPYVHVKFDESDSVLSAYRAASPIYHLPLLVPTLIVVGGVDVDVPPDSGYTFHQRAVECNNNVVVPTDIQFIDIPDADHYALCNSSTAAWMNIFNKIISMLRNY
jgi:hypothetical protein